MQFRMIENRMGLLRENRTKHNKQNYNDSLTDTHSRLMLEDEKKESLFDALQKWLEKCPYVTNDSNSNAKDNSFDFVKEFKWAIEKYKKVEMRKFKDKDSKECKEKMKEIDNSFLAILNEKEFEKQKMRLSMKSCHVVLMILFYKEEKGFGIAYQIIESVQKLEDLMTQWRNNHVSMVRRQLGSKRGTGGSSGVHYLRTTAFRHSVFEDLFALSSYLIPKQYFNSFK